MHRRQRARRAALGLALAAALALLPQSSTLADEWYPGLPDNVHLDYFGPGWGSTGVWGGASQSGISYATRAKQWFRSPAAMVTFVPGTFAGGVKDGVDTNAVKGVAYLVSPKGAPENYGYMAPMTVRSVGFGLMPVEATVQISQRRENGYPIPFEAEIPGKKYQNFDRNINNGRSIKMVSSPSVIDDAVNVQILKVLVDGVDLGLTGDCRTETPAPMRVASPEYTIFDPDRPPTDPTVDKSYMAEWFRTHDPSEYYHPDYGGQFRGSITIPPFTGCTTSAGDDLSALMTLSVSGPDNPVTATAGWACFSPMGNSSPVPPGQSTPKLAEGWECDGPKLTPYPARTAD